MMRVGIVTLPFHFNYGGILQAFALQKAIQNLGFEPIIIVFKRCVLNMSLFFFLISFCYFVSNRT